MPNTKCWNNLRWQELRRLTRWGLTQSPPEKLWETIDSSYMGCSCKFRRQMKKKTFLKILHRFISIIFLENLWLSGMDDFNNWWEWLESKQKSVISRKAGGYKYLIKRRRKQRWSSPVRQWLPFEGHSTLALHRGASPSLRSVNRRKTCQKTVACAARICTGHSQALFLVIIS